MFKSIYLVTPYIIIFIKLTMVYFDKVISVIEIADKYNISKQGMFKHIDKIEISTSKVGRKTVIVGSEEINRSISKIEMKVRDFSVNYSTRNRTYVLFVILLIIMDW